MRERYVEFLLERRKHKNLTIAQAHEAQGGAAEAGFDPGREGQGPCRGLVASTLEGPAEPLAVGEESATR